MGISKRYSIGLDEIRNYLANLENVNPFPLLDFFHIFYKIWLLIQLATGLGSIPGTATIIRLLVDSIVSGIIYDTVNLLLKEGVKTMDKKILLIGLGVCGGMV